MTPEDKLQHALPVLKALASMSDTTIELVIPTQVRRQAREALDRMGEEYQVR